MMTKAMMVGGSRKGLEESMGRRLKGGMRSVAVLKDVPSVSVKNVFGGDYYGRFDCRYIRHFA